VSVQSRPDAGNLAAAVRHSMIFRKVLRQAQHEIRRGNRLCWWCARWRPSSWRSSWGRCPGRGGTRAGCSPWPVIGLSWGTTGISFKANTCRQAYSTPVFQWWAQSPSASVFWESGPGRAGCLASPLRWAPSECCTTWRGVSTTARRSSFALCRPVVAPDRFLHPVLLGRQALVRCPACSICYLATRSSPGPGRDHACSYPLPPSCGDSPCAPSPRLRPSWPLGCLLRSPWRWYARCRKAAGLLALALVGTLAAFPLLAWGERLLLGSSLPATYSNAELYRQVVDRSNLLAYVFVLDPSVRLTWPFCRLSSHPGSSPCATAAASSWVTCAVQPAQRPGAMPPEPLGFGVYMAGLVPFPVDWLAAVSVSSLVRGSIFVAVLLTDSLAGSACHV